MMAHKSLQEADESRRARGGRWRARVGRGRKGLLVAAFALGLWWPVAWGAALLLVERRELPRADAIAVLGGGAAYVERTRHAARLFREGRAPVVLLTNDGELGGWSPDEQRNPLFHERAARELERAGVTAASVRLLPGTVSGTYEEASALRDYAAAHGLRSLIVVTSLYHSRRALWALRRAFRGSGIEVGLDAPPAGVGTPAPAVWWLSARGWRAVPPEYPKLVYYRLRYG